ncbi:portal protein [Vibrio phage ICP1]|nr:portal protein [Vibrio phage ICP1]QVV97757.1 portal protein [Vibrio phage ICP1]QVV97984.1 portal protein [Vibrio phage ICP1]QVV98211.1 portal protein [Vibrio phage ICP1]QVV98437.1 portal protein [Vibrio phage ICP1]
MTNRNRARNNRQQKKLLTKALQNTTREQRGSGVQKGTIAIEAIRRMKDALRPHELSQGQRYHTYQMMLLDAAVWSSWEIRKFLMQEAIANGKFKYDKTNPISSKIVQYLEYCINTMEYQTLRSIAGQSEDGVYNSFAPFEVVTWEGTGDYIGYRTLRNMTYIDPLTLDRSRPYETADGGNRIVNWRQNKSAFRDTTGTGLSLQSSVSGIQDIDARKVAVVCYGGTPYSPITSSCFDAAYDPWCEKRLINSFLLQGVARDMAGMPVMELPLSFMEAAKVVGSDEYLAMELMKQQMTNLHAGDQAYMFLPSDTHSETGQGAKLYNLTFKGVDGGGKNFTLDELITQKNMAIHKAIGALNLNSSEQGTASYNSLEGQTNLQFHYVKADCRNFDEMINKQVIPLLLRLNADKFGEVSQKDIPVWKHGEIVPLTSKEFFKGLQQGKLYIPRIPVIVNKVMEMLSIDHNFEEDMDVEELSKLMPEFDSRDRSGESNGSSGFGDNTQLDSGGDEA